MKYEEEVKEVINIMIPRESWMNDEDYQEAVELTLKLTDTNLQKISDDIEEGVKNGHPVEVQLNLLKALIFVSSIQP